MLLHVIHKFINSFFNLLMLLTQLPFRDQYFTLLLEKSSKLHQFPFIALEMFIHSASFIKNKRFCLLIKSEPSAKPDHFDARSKKVSKFLWIKLKSHI